MLFIFFFVSVSFIISDKAKVSGFLVSFWCSFAVHAPLGRVKGILPTSWNWTRVCRSRLVGSWQLQDTVQRSGLYKGIRKEKRRLGFDQARRVKVLEIILRVGRVWYSTKFVLYLILLC